MLACAGQPVAVLEVSRTIRTTQSHTTYGNRRLVVRVEVDVYRYRVYHGVPAWSGTRRGTHRQRKEAVPLLVSFLDGW